MSTRHVLAAIAAVATALLAQAAAAATGLTVLAAPPGSGPVTVFYPTAAPATSLKRGPFTVEAAQDATPLRGNGRLIVMSHGSGGAPWTQTDLAQTLVDAGLTVAMPEHAGDNWHDMSDVGPVTWKHRPQEVSQAIDAMAADARFAPLLEGDPDLAGIVRRRAGRRRPRLRIRRPGHLGGCRWRQRNLRARGRPGAR